MNLVYVLIVGATAGWLAGHLTRGHGFGLFGNIGVGVVGAILGSFVFGLLGLASYGLVGSLVMATVGAVLLLYLVQYLKKA